MLGAGITSAHFLVRDQLKRLSRSHSRQICVTPSTKVSVRVCAPYCFSLSERNVILSLFNGSLWMNSTCMPAKIPCFFCGLPGFLTVRRGRPRVFSVRRGRPRFFAILPDECIEQPAASREEEDAIFCWTF